MAEAIRARSLYLTYAALMALLALTLGSSYLALGVLNVVLNLGIAVAKAVLVMLVFMRLGPAGGQVRLVAAAGFVFLAVMLALTLMDYGLRPG